MPEPNTHKDILHIFSTLAVGGPQRRFADYLACSKKEYNHSVYAMDGNYDALQLMEGFAPKVAGFEQVPKGNTLRAIWQCRKLLKQAQPDLLVTYNWGATEWALANKYFPVCPTIHIQDGFTEEEHGGEIARRQRMRAFAYSRCATVVVPSKTLEALVCKNWGIPANRVKFIPNGIEVARFTSPANPDLLKAFGIKALGETIGTIAALRPEKNLGRLIEAFSSIENQYPDAQLVIVGDGVGMPALKMLSERICEKNRVIFTGQLAQPEQIIGAFNIFALSSDTEQMPLSVIEAMAASLPIASTDVGDISEMVDETNRKFVVGQEAQTLRNSLRTLLEAPDVAQKIGQANHQKASEQYSLAQMVAHYDLLFAEH